MERTLVLIKPDAMQRGLAGEVISRLERRGLKIVAIRMLKVSTALAKKHYAEHDGKPFFKGLVEYITSSPIIAAVFEGNNAIKATRQTMGATNPIEAATGSVRADFGPREGPQPDARLRLAGERQARDRAVLRRRAADRVEARHGSLGVRVGGLVRAAASSRRTRARSRAADRSDVRPCGRRYW